MDLKTFVSAVFMLTLVMDPLSNIPMFISALKEVPAERRRTVLARELLIALLVAEDEGAVAIRDAVVGLIGGAPGARLQGTAHPAGAVDVGS